MPELLEQRLSLVAELGLARYAEMIGQFASMERNAARAWSAITDGALEEAAASVVRAKKGLEEARALIPT